MAAFTLSTVAIYLPVAAATYIWLRPSIGWEALVFVAVSGALDLAYFLMLTRGYAVGDLSLVYPLARGTGPALSVAGAVLFLGDRPSPLALVGAGIIVAGIVIMAWSPSVVSGREFTLSIGFALATGVCIAAYTLWDSEGVEELNPVLYNYGREIVRLVLIAPFALATVEARRRIAATFRDDPVAAVGVGILAPGAYTLVLAALLLSSVAYVAPAREISIVFGALLGWRLLGERDAPRRVSGALAIVAGVCCLAGG
jgi:drug/metabolite transporter (DMT)-like permease